MRTLLPLLVGLGACASPRGTTEPAGPESTSHATASELDGSPPEAAQQLMEELLAGERSVEEVMTAGAWSSGWPLFDGETTWFVYPATGGSWSLAGDLNDWEPTPMEQGDGFWYLGIEGQPSEGSGYKFVNGGTDWIADPWARAYRYDSYGELSLAVAPTDVPHLQRWPGLQGHGLAPREVVVYRPAGDGPFDVLYAQDGQNLFDPAAMWGGWRLDDTLPATPNVMVVGVFNTPDRMSEYTHVDDSVLGYDITAWGDDYAALIHEDLRPHIEQTYPTSGTNGLLGSSLGGLISLHIAQRYAGAYDFVASMSGTLGWGRFAYDHPTQQDLWTAAPVDDIVVYVDSGGSTGPDGACQDLDGDGYPEDDPDSFDNYCENRQFADALAAHGYVWDETLFHWHALDAPHQETAWAERVSLPLQLFSEVR